MKTHNFSKYPNSIQSTSLLFPIAMLMILASCASSTPLSLGRNAQSDDTTPPTLSNIQFPTSGSVLEEGSVIITGVAIDANGEEEGELNSDHPVFLEIDVIPGSSLEDIPGATPLRTQQSIVNEIYPESLDPSFFDWETGEFRIEFDDYQRLKPGPMIFRLYAADAADNMSEPVTAWVLSGDIEGGDIQDLYDARMEYGENFEEVLDAFIYCLEVYDTDYSADIEILTYMKTFVHDTYTISPAMYTWSEPLYDFLRDLRNAVYPSNTIDRAMIQPGINAVANSLQDWYEGDFYMSSYPFYKYEMTEEEILEARQKVIDGYTLDEITVDTDTEGDVVTCHIVIDGYDYLVTEELRNVADFTITADPEESLQIEGYIGEDNGHEIVSSDYNPPIKFLKLFSDENVEDVFYKYRQ